MWFSNSEAGRLGLSCLAAEGQPQMQEHPAKERAVALTQRAGVPGELHMPVSAGDTLMLTNCIWGAGPGEPRNSLIPPLEGDFMSSVCSDLGGILEAFLRLVK